MNLKEMLLKENIVQIKEETEEPFTLKSGKKSRIFIDIKQASLNPDILKEITGIIDSISREQEWYFDRVASVAIGGIPIATILSLRWNIHQVIIRSETHNRGMKQKIIGDCKGLMCLLIEDVATSGGTIINTVRSIREAGGFCEDVIVVVDREEGAKEWCLQNKINIHSCLKKSDFLDEKILKNNEYF